MEFKKVESTEIKIETPQNYEMEGSSAMYQSAKGEPSSPLLRSQKNSKTEEEILISELDEKIQKEKATIKNLNYSSSSNSVMAFPAILGLLIVSFCLGSVGSYLLF